MHIVNVTSSPDDELYTCGVKNSTLLKSKLIFSYFIYSRVLTIIYFVLANLVQHLESLLFVRSQLGSSIVRFLSL